VGDGSEGTEGDQGQNKDEVLAFHCDDGSHDGKSNVRMVFGVQRSSATFAIITRRDMSEQPSISLSFDTVVVAPEYAATKRQILRERGLAETFAVNGDLSLQLLDAVKVLQMTELEVYFYEGDLESVITPRTTMNSLIYLFKRLRELNEQFSGSAYSQVIQQSMEKLYTFCDAFIRFRSCPI
jgi:hypothetical protein